MYEMKDHNFFRSYEQRKNDPFCLRTSKIFGYLFQESNLRDNNMKHIVIVLGDIYNNPGANAICVKKISDQLLIEGYKVTVVCQAQKSNRLKEIDFDGYKIFFMNVFRDQLWYYANKKKNDSKNIYAKILWMSIQFSLRVLQGIYAIFLWPSTGKWFTKKALKQLKTIDTGSKIDCIITVSMPYEAHLAGYRFKSHRKEVKWITYTLDSFVDSPTLQRYYIFKLFKKLINKRSERKVFKSANANFLSLALKEFVDTKYNQNNQKFNWVSFPLILKPNLNTQTEYFDKTKINVVFAGSFYRIIRNPEYCLRLFSMIQNEEIILHLFHKGDCLDIIEKYTRLSEKIIAYGSLPVEKIYEVESQADILLSIGNSVAHFYPSKLLEYISFGKPIINVHDKRYDYSSLLNRYPLVLNIENNGNNYDRDKERLVRFCEKNKNKRIEFSCIERLYWESTPAYISSLFINEIERPNTKNNVFQ